ncbi:MAG: TIM-barrel domain-containing protein, partial [Cryomorphaceae bacterium]
MAYSAFHPLMRAHTMINSKQAEPWSFGEECTEAARNYINLRYRLMPHLYSLFYEASQNGMPPVRSLLFRFYHEWKVFSTDFENQFMLGEHLLICPVRAEAEFAKVYLPEGRWYGFFNDAVYEGGREHVVELQRDTIPVFMQAGGILPEQSAVKYTAEAHDGILRLHVYAGGEGSYTLYEDDGETADGVSLKRDISHREGHLKIGAGEGGYTSNFDKVRVYFHGSNPQNVSVNGVPLEIRKKDFRFLNAISNFDPYETYPEAAKVIEQLPFAEFSNNGEAAEITFS